MLAETVTDEMRKISAESGFPISRILDLRKKGYKLVKVTEVEIVR